MKRLLVYMLVAVMVVGSTGCHKKEKEPEAPVVEVDESVAEPLEIEEPEEEIEEDDSDEEETDEEDSDEDDADEDDLDDEDDEDGNSDLQSFEKSGKSKKLSFEAISQYPELPTGCEVTSLAMTLNYYGIPCDKCEIADNYLDKGPVGTVNFREAFEGDPRDGSSFGCYAPVLVNSANRVLAAYGSSLTATEVTGNDLEDLFSYIDQDMPVIVWGTQDCQQGHYSVTWTVNGQDMTWFTPEHCMVLVGYDSGSVWVADPIYGDVRSYDIESFESAYDSLYQQAIIIQ